MFIGFEGVCKILLCLRFFTVRILGVLAFKSLNSWLRYGFRLSGICILYDITRLLVLSLPVLACTGRGAKRF